MAIDGKQGAVISEAPVEVIYFEDDIEFGIKNHHSILRVPKRFIRGSRDIMTIKNFVEDVYKAGFSDCADKLMNPSEQRQDKIVEIICGALNKK